MDVQPLTIQSSAAAATETATTARGHPDAAHVSVVRATSSDFPTPWPTVDRNTARPISTHASAVDHGHIGSDFPDNVLRISSSPAAQGREGGKGTGDR